MSLTALRRTTAGVAVLAAGLAGAAAMPTLHADAAAPAHTSLTIRTAHAAVAPGGSDLVSGALLVEGAGTGAGRTVSLEARPAGADAFTPVATSVAGTHGGVHATVTPDVTTRYRWAYAGDTDTRPSLSGIATVRVRTPQHPATRIGTSLSIRAVRHVVRLDGSDVVRGRLRAGRIPLRDRLVLLESRTGDATSWTFEGAHRTRRLGEVAFTVQPAADTAYQLVFLGTPLLRPARSAVVRIVTRPGVTIAADPTVIDHGGSSTVSGVVTDVSGTPIEGATVKLLARKAGTTQVTAIGSSVTAADGSVSFVESPTATTIYRLRLVAATGVRPALSSAARVTVRTPTSLSIRGRATDTDYVVSGTLRGGGHALAHRSVTLMSLASGAADWTDAGSALTDGHGTVRFHEATAPGTDYRLVYAGGPRFSPSSSGTVVS